jgi:multidrug efflux pump
LATVTVKTQISGQLMRFRPIMVTASTAIAGALPLALSSADRPEMRRPLGISVIARLLVSQLLTLYTTPVVYLYVDRWRVRWTRRREVPNWKLKA